MKILPWRSIIPSPLHILSQVFELQGFVYIPYLKEEHWYRKIFSFASTYFHLIGYFSGILDFLQKSYKTEFEEDYMLNTHWI